MQKFKQISNSTLMIDRDTRCRRLLAERGVVAFAITLPLFACAASLSAPRGNKGAPPAQSQEALNTTTPGWSARAATPTPTYDPGAAAVQGVPHPVGCVSGTCEHDRLPNNVPVADATGVFTTVSANGSIDLGNEFFQDLGTNGRRCVSCHVPTVGWTITPKQLQTVFDATRSALSCLVNPMWNRLS
jgi:hypothetical protein